MIEAELKYPIGRRLRLWPGVVIAILQLFIRYALPAITPEAAVYGVVGWILGGVAVIFWWVFFSRAPWSERLGAVILIGIGLFATSRFLDKSVATGAQGMLFPLLAVPVLSLVLVIWAVTTRHLPDRTRRATMIVTILLGCGAWTLVRTGGLTARFDNDLQWRWAKTPEELLLEKSAAEPSAISPMPSPTRLNGPPEVTSGERGSREAATKPGGEPGTHPKGFLQNDWPGFRGADRDAVVTGVRLKTNWDESPPVILWRRAVGPGWSSFAVGGDLLYTQEQMGDDEVVACHRLSTGERVWAHRNAARFWESNGGAGPRGTPTLSRGRIYSFGATGILNSLDAGDGAVVWSRNVSSDSGTEIPGWGFASSPLIFGDSVIIAAAGKLVAYDVADGRLSWIGPDEGNGYSSPHLISIGGISQLLLMSGSGATSIMPSDGVLLWKHLWKGNAIVQPAQLSNSDLLISTSGAAGGVGMRRLAVEHGSAGWFVTERWNSGGLKPYFNDFVVHKNHAYGFDGSILACIELQEGQRKWKGGRYGNGQLLLLPAQDLLLVLSEEGEVVLVRAIPDEFSELAHFQAIEGKTWNHPVLVGDILLLRNGQEMAAFRMPILKR